MSKRGQKLINLCNISLPRSQNQGKRPRLESESPLRGNRRSEPSWWRDLMSSKTETGRDVREEKGNQNVTRTVRPGVKTLLKEVNRSLFYGPRKSNHHLQSKDNPRKPNNESAGKQIFAHVPTIPNQTAAAKRQLQFDDSHPVVVSRGALGVDESSSSLTLSNHSGTSEPSSPMAIIYDLDPVTGVLIPMQQSALPNENDCTSTHNPDTNTTAASFSNMNCTQTSSDDFLSSSEFFPVIFNAPVEDISPEKENTLLGEVQSNAVSYPLLSTPQSAAPAMALQLITPESEEMNTSTRKRRQNQSENGATSARKRSSNPSKWKSVEAKNALNSGQAHISPRGIERRQRTPREPCHEHCKRCKHPKLTEEERKKLFDKFWAIGDHTRQWDYILKHVKCSTPVKKITTPSKKGSKNVSRKYFFTVKGKEIPVCKTMFLSTLDICDEWVKTALGRGRVGGTISPDKRGKHDKRPKRTAAATKEKIKEHINLYPRVESHYTRQRSKREYLEHGLSTIKMHKNYLAWAVESNITPVASERQYREVFNKEFNIGFFKPRKDQCKVCNQYKFATEAAKKELKVAHNKHDKNKTVSLQLKDEDKAAAKQHKTITTICFDMQKVLTCPRSETSVFFYRNKLSLFNFTIFDMAEKKGFCYVWNETVAKKGSNEVGSHLYDYISKKASEGMKDFRLYSDSPTGQNKNRFVFAVYLLLSMKFKIKITHRFLEPGHTHMEVDSMHALIEKTAGRRDLFVPQEWIDLIRSSKQNGEPYLVTEVDQVSVFNLKPMVEMSNWDNDQSGRKIYWSKVKEICVDSAFPNTVTFKYEYEGEAKKLLVNQRRGRPINWETYNPPKAYTGPLPLKQKKIRDIQWLLKETNQGIPERYSPYYENLLASVITCGNDDSDEEEAEEL